jgi:hypothetical protein
MGANWFESFAPLTIFLILFLITNAVIRVNLIECVEGRPVSLEVYYLREIIGQRKSLFRDSPRVCCHR